MTTSRFRNSSHFLKTAAFPALGLGLFTMALVASKAQWASVVVGSLLLLSLLVFVGIAAALSRAQARAKASQQEESEQRERLRVTFASIGEAVIATDSAGNVSSMNAPAEDLTGWPLSEAQAKPLSDIFRLFNAETGQAVQDPAQQVLKEQREIRFRDHTVLVSRDGTERSIAASAAPIRSTTGAIGGVVLAVQDVTEQQQSRRALQELEARSSAILETALDAIITSNEKGEILEWNRAAERIFGYNRDEVIGRQMAELIIPPNLREQHRRGMARYMATGEARVLGRRIEINAIRRGGEEFPVELGITRLSTEGPAIFTAHIRDITVRKQADDALRAAEKQLKEHAANLEKTVAERTAELQQVIGELEAFSYSLSHDMRAPLRAIYGMAQALMEDYGDTIPAEGTTYLKRITAAAVRLDRLIQDVLSYSRVVRADVKLVPVDLEQLVSDIIAQYPEFQAPNAQVVVRSPLLKVMGQEASLTQCLSNLLGNAVKFVAPGTMPRVEIRTQEENDHVRLYIQDNGVGIEPRHWDRIFGIFERVYPESEFPGTGIGLAIVKKGVERMGGTIELESLPGKGTTFCITLAKARDS